jgi:hypothetical protein
MCKPHLTGSIRNVTSCIAMAAGVLVIQSAHPAAWAGPIPNSWSTTGDYDEQVTQPNTVDAVATGSSLTDKRFAARVEEAYLRDAGGVIDATVLGAYAAYGKNETKVLNFGAGDLGIGSPSTSATPVSGTSSFAITSVSRRGTFGFNGFVYGAAPGERVVEMGMTMLSYSGTTYPNIQIVAQLDNGSTMAAQTSITQSAGSRDTFVGFTAPPGRLEERRRVHGHPQRFEHFHAASAFGGDRQTRNPGV